MNLYKKKLTYYASSHEEGDSQYGNLIYIYFKYLKYIPLLIEKQGDIGKFKKVENSYSRIIKLK